MKKLKGYQDGSQSLLDNTIIVYGSAINDGNAHGKRNLPTLIAGKAAGLKSGQVISFKRKTPLARVHLTLAQKMGVPLKEFAGEDKIISEM